MSDLVRWILAALAVFRLAELVALDDGPGRVFARLRAWAGCHPVDAVRETLGALVQCPYCVGVWAAAVCAVLVLWPSRVGDIALAALGLAGAQAFLEEVGNGHSGESR